MPAPVQIKTNSRMYSIPILTGEMDTLAQQIEANKNELIRLNERTEEALAQLNANSNALLVLYIQQTGSLPTRELNNRDSDSEIEIER